MGHRCSFAIKDGNAVELFYGHWSAVQLPDQLFWGPDYVETYIRGHEAVDWWMEDIFADGCVGLDKDKKVMLVHRGASDLAEGLEGNFFFGLMRALWQEQGWRVEKVDSMEEIAVYMGYPVEAVRWMPEPEEAWPLDSIKDKLGPDERIYTLISTPSARFGAHACAKRLLANGPKLIAHLAHFPQLDNPPVKEIFPEAILKIDPTSKEISVNSWDPYWERHFSYLKEAWSGWTFHFELRPWDDDEPLDTSSANMEAVQNRVFEALISPAQNPVPSFVTSMSMVGATLAPGVAKSPPVLDLSIDDRSALVRRAIELLLETRHND